MPARSDIRSPQHDYRVVLGAQAALVVIGLAAVAGTVGATVGSVHHDVHAARDVDVLGLTLTYPALNVAAVVLLLFALLGAAVLVTALVSLTRQLRASRRFVAGLRVLGPLPDHPSVSVIDERTPHAFCAGFFHPHVFVSSGAVELLEPNELEAVVRHELSHKQLHDPLRFVLGRALVQALFFLPALRPLADRYTELAEQRADSAAVSAAAGDSAPLASALLAFESHAPAGSAGISPERVDRLLGAPASGPLPAVLLALSAAILSVLIVVVWKASAAASVDATLNLPVVSSQPCVLVLAFIPLVAGVSSVTASR